MQGEVTRGDAIFHLLLLIGHCSLVIVHWSLFIVHWGGMKREK